MLAPLVALFSVTDCVVEYVPATGENVGAAVAPRAVMFTVTDPWLHWSPAPSCVLNFAVID